MKRLVFLFVLVLLFEIRSAAEELKIKAKFFESDQQKGISIFQGKVHATKGYDEINASKVTIYTDKEKKPIKFVAEGDVKFRIEDETKKHYLGYAQKVIYIPKKKEYHFYNDVYLYEVEEKKEIRGEEVVFKVLSGKAYAKGMKERPVIMIFDIDEKEKK